MNTKFCRAASPGFDSLRMATHSFIKNAPRRKAVTPTSGAVGCLQHGTFAQYVNHFALQFTNSLAHRCGKLRANWSLSYVLA